MQTWGAFRLFRFVKSRWNIIKANWTPLFRFILLYAGLAFAVKILLQLGSNIPAVNQFAFGFRNIVIAYLHLVLLMCVSAFLVGQLLMSKELKIHSRFILGVKGFLLGVFLNEMVLGLMGLFSTVYFSIPFAAESLFVISSFILCSVGYMFFNMKANPHPKIE
jgi:hypothetical protein